MSALAAPGAPTKQKVEVQRQGKKKPKKLRFSPDAAPGAPTKKKVEVQRQGKKKPKKLRFAPEVMLRQPSEKDEHGDSIQGTEVYDSEPYCPVNKRVFFAGDMIDLPFHFTALPTAFVAKRVLNSASSTEQTPRDTANWLLAYLYQKKNTLLSSGPGKSVGLGDSRLTSRHIYIIDSIITALKAFLQTTTVESHGVSHNVRRAAMASARARSNRINDSTAIKF